jgi:hypothetical protein
VAEVEDAEGVMAEVVEDAGVAEGKKIVARA